MSLKLRLYFDYEHLARVVRLIFATAWQAANQDTRIRSIDRTQPSPAMFAVPVPSPVTTTFTITRVSVLYAECL